MEHLPAGGQPRTLGGGGIMKKKAKWTSGEDKLWDGDKYVLRLHKRCVRLFDLYDELKKLGLPTWYVSFDILGVYKKLTIGLERGRYKFDDCSDILLRIEEFFDEVSVERLFDKLRGLGVGVDDVMWDFCLRVGFIDDDVTRRVARELLKRGGV